MRFLSDDISMEETLDGRVDKNLLSHIHEYVVYSNQMLSHSRLFLTYVYKWIYVYKTYSVFLLIPPATIQDI